MSFSVVPALTTLWARLLVEALGEQGVRVLLGDCGGGLSPPRGAAERVSIVRMENAAHGLKLDHFVRDRCRTRYVVVCDDDVFWLSGLPLRWSRRRLARDPGTAVVSLAPRDPLPRTIADRLGIGDREFRPMGSFCLVLRRDLWLREGLSFRAVAAGDNPHGLFFDTADYAHLELLRRGHAVAIAPKEVRQDLVFFERTSSWILRMQEARGALGPELAGRASRAKKALQAAVLGRSIARVLPQLGERDLPDPVSSAVAERVRAVCTAQLGRERARIIQTGTEQAFSRVARRLAELDR